MKYSRKIALFTVFTLMIMNFTTINVQALGNIANGMSAEQYEINEEAVSNYNSNILNDDISSLLGENNDTDVEVGEITVENYDSNGNLISSETNEDLGEADTEPDLSDEVLDGSSEIIDESDEVIDEAEDVPDTSEEVNDESEDVNSDESEITNEEITNEEVTNEESSEEPGELDAKEEVEEDIPNDSLFDEGINSITEENEIEESMNTYSITSRASAIYDVNIISTNSTTVAQMEAWAKSKGATTEFIGLAKLYNKYASSRGGVNWVLAYVQAAKETGYGKFGGVLTAAYHNPCGLKNSTGGADDDPEAHKKFDNWDQGVMAHLDHLALYAGASGYPKTTYVPSYKSSGLGSKETYDPRHTGNWYATNVYKSATTAISLGGKWAPSTTYGVEIFRMYCEATGTSYAPAKSALDTPTASSTVVNNSLRVKGWALSAVGIKDVKVYLDNNYLGTASYGKTRTDVAATYPKYYNSENSGFDTTFDVGSYGKGTKTLKVVITANDGTTQTISRSITLKLAERAALETPTSKTNVANGVLSIKGWALASSGVKYVYVYIDNKKVANATYGAVRTDVTAKYPGYSSDSKVGFTASVNTLNLESGTKNLKIVVGANDGTTQTLNTTFINTVDAKGELETPANNGIITDGILNIKGWGISSSGIKYVNVYVNNEKVGSATYGKTRTDIGNKYPQYTNSSKSGYEGSFDISKLSSGNKELKVIVMSNDGSYQRLIRTINVKQKSISNLETPTTSTVVSNGKLEIKGWALADSGIKYINVYVDSNDKVGQAKIGVSRPDVQKAYPQYKDSAKAGFTATVDVSKMPAGTKTLQLLIRANDGTYQKIVVKFTLKLSFVASLETPESSAAITDDTLEIKGYAMSSSAISSVVVYVDGQKLGTASYGVSRSDVASKYPNYSTASKSGFTASIDVSKLSRGTKKLEVVITNKAGETKTISRNINLKLKSVCNLETPTAATVTTNGTLNIKGWALADSGIKYINVYLDSNQKIGQATLGVTRNDVKKAYPNYKNADKSGFTASIDTSKLPAGTKTLQLLIRANDNSYQKVIVKFKMELKAVASIDAPYNNTVISNGKLNIKGWGLNPSGVRSVYAYIDGVNVGKVTYGIARDDIKSRFPQYSNSAKAGFEASIDVSKIATGTKEFKIIVNGNDGTKQILKKTIVFKSNLPSRSSLDEPVVNETITDTSLYIKGWALEPSDVKFVNAYIDNVKVGTLSYGNKRTDVEKVYPGYSVGSACGFSGTISLAGIATGTRTLKVIVFAKDGTKQYMTRTINVGSKKTVYIDPGHDYGGDQGAFATHGSITYSETEINIDIAEKLRTELINMGYNVVMARRKGERPTSPDYRTNLWNRINAANDMKADFYVSIHNNMSGSSSTTGTEVYYSSDNPNKLSASALNSKVTASKSAATKVSQGVASALGTNNRGAKDDSFMVVRYTNMPAILVECGFMSNAAEVKKLTTASYQTKIAKAIANGIKATIN